MNIKKQPHQNTHTHFSISKLFEELISLVHDRIIKGFPEIKNECESNFYIHNFLCLFYTFISNRMCIGVSQTDKTTYFVAALCDTRLKWHQRQNQIIMDIIWIYKNVRKFFFLLFWALKTSDQTMSFVISHGT